MSAPSFVCFCVNVCVCQCDWNVKVKRECSRICKDTRCKDTRYLCLDTQYLCLDSHYPVFIRLYALCLEPALPRICMNGLFELRGMTCESTGTLGKEDLAYDPGGYNTYGRALYFSRYTHYTLYLSRYTHYTHYTLYLSRYTHSQSLSQSLSQSQSQSQSL